MLATKIKHGRNEQFSSRVYNQISSIESQWNVLTLIKQNSSFIFLVYYETSTRCTGSTKMMPSFPQSLYLLYLCLGNTD